MKKLLLAALAVGLGLAACAHTGSGREGDGGVKTLRSNGMFEESATPAPTTYGGKDAGENALLPRGFAGAPPQVPHAIDDFAIEADYNPCLDCHMPTYAAEGTTPIPKSHLQREELSLARFNCDQCHVPQADAPALVRNENDIFIIPVVH